MKRTLSNKLCFRDIRKIGRQYRNCRQPGCFTCPGSHHLSEIEKQIFINAGLYRFGKIILPRTAVYKIVHHNLPLLRIDNPIFPHARLFVQRTFSDIIHRLTRRRDDLHRPVRRTVTPLLVQLVHVADHRNVRLHIIVFVVLDIDRTRRGKYPARPPLFP